MCSSVVFVLRIVSRVVVGYQASAWSQHMSGVDLCAFVQMNCAYMVISMGSLDNTVPSFVEAG